MASMLSKLGLGFFANARGAGRELTKLDKLIENIGDGIDSAAKGVISLSTNLGNIALDKVRQASDEFDNLTRAASDNINLSSSLEATYADFDKEARKLAATNGVNVKTIKAMSSGFYDANLDMSSMLETATALNKEGLDLKKFGFKDLEQFMKAADVAGMDAKETILGLDSLVKGFGFSEGQAADYLNAMTAIGQNTKLGGAAIQNFLGVNSQLNEQLRALNPNITAEEFAQLGQDYAIAAAGIMEVVGGDADSAMQQVLQLGERLGSTQDEYNKLFAGIGGSIPDLMNELAISMGGFQEVGNNPLEFMTMLNERLVKENISEEEANQIRHRILNALGADVDYAAASDTFNKFIGSVGNLKKEVKDAGPAFKNLSKEYRTGFTFQDRYDRGMERLEHTSKSLTARLGVQRDVLKNQRRAIKLVTHEITDMATAHLVNGKNTKEGTKQLEGMDLAANVATRTLLAFNTAGLQGMAIEGTNMLKQFKPVEALFKRIPGQNEANAKSAQAYTERLAEKGQVALAILPALSQAGINTTNLNAAVQLATGPLGLFNRMLGGMPGKLLGILGPIGLVAGGAFLIHRAYKDKGGFAQFGEDVVSGLRKGFSMAHDYLEKNGPAIATSIETGFSSAIEFMTTGSGGQLIGDVADFTGNLLVKGLNSAADGINNADSGAIGKKIGAFIFDGLSAIGSVAWRAITGAFTDPAARPDAQKSSDTLGMKIADGLANVGSAVIRAIGMGIVGMFSGAVDFLMDGDVPIEDKVKAVGAAVGGAFVVGFGLSIAGKALGMGVAGVVGKAMMAPAMMMGRGAMRGGRRVGGRAVGMMRRVGARRMMGGMAMVGAGIGVASYLQNNKKIKTDNAVDQATADGQRVGGAILAGINGALMGLPAMFIGYIFGSTEKAEVVLKQFYNFLVAEAEKTMFDFKLAFDTLPPLVKLGASKMMGFFEGLYYSIGVGIAKAVGTVDENFNYMVGLGKDIAFKLRMKFSLFFDSLQAGGRLAVNGLEDLFIGMKDTIINDAIAPILQKIQGLAQNVPAELLAKTGVDPSILRIADNLGLGADDVEAKRRARQEQLKARAEKDESDRFKRLYNTAIEMGIPPSSLRRLGTSAQLRSLMDMYDPANAERMAKEAAKRNESVVRVIENEAAGVARERQKYEKGLSNQITSSVQENARIQKKIDADLQRQLRLEEAGGLGATLPKPVGSTPSVKPVGNIPTPARERAVQDGGVSKLQESNQKGFKGLGDRFAKEMDRLIGALGGMKPVRTAGTSVTSDMTAYT